MHPITIGQIALLFLFDRLVVISLDHNCDARRVLAVAGVITEECKTFRAAGVGVSQTRVGRFDVAVNVGEKREE